MARRIGIVIAVNTPTAPGCVVGPLSVVEKNAGRLVAQLMTHGYDDVTVLRGAEATVTRVEAEMLRAARALRAGDLLFLAFSGHGCSRPDENAIREGNGATEHWCLADGILVDDRLHGLLCEVKEEVRVVVLADSCHAGGMRSFLPGGLLAGHGGVYANEAAAVEMDPLHRLRQLTAREFGPRSARRMEADVLMLAACKKGESAAEGLFMEFLLDAWESPGPYRSLDELFGVVANHVRNKRSKQSPEAVIMSEDQERVLTLLRSLPPFPA